MRARQWPEVSDFVARFCTLRESENTRTCENFTRFVTRITYLGPLPSEGCVRAALQWRCGSVAAEWRLCGGSVEAVPGQRDDGVRVVLVLHLR